MSYRTKPEDWFEVVEAPAILPRDLSSRTSYFLAGSIEMGTAQNWQEEVIGYFEKQLRYSDNVPRPYLRAVILNPRRKDWDSSWEQSYSNKQFNEQVRWELNALKRCDFIFMHFEPNTKSPITLLELGLFANARRDHFPNDKKLVVHCPEGFWRKGNVDIVCHEYGIHTVDSLEGFKDFI